MQLKKQRPTPWVLDVVGGGKWIQHVIERKTIAGRKARTIDSYKFCAGRICKAFEKYPLLAVTPSMLSEFFTALQKETVNTLPRAIAKVPLDLAIAQSGYSKTRFAHAAGIGEATIDRAIQQKPVSIETAGSIAKILGAPLENLFTIKTNKRKLSRDTIQDYRRFVSLVFTLAKRENLIPSNPILSADFPATKIRKKVKTLQPEDVQQILRAAANEPLQKQVLIHLAFITGCRKGELAAIRWQSIKWAESAILIDQEILYTRDRGVYGYCKGKSHSRPVHPPYPGICSADYWCTFPTVPSSLTATANTCCGPVTDNIGTVGEILLRYAESFKKMGAGLYVVTEDEGKSVGIRKG